MSGSRPTKRSQAGASCGAADVPAAQPVVWPPPLSLFPAGAYTSSADADDASSLDLDDPAAAAPFLGGGAEGTKPAWAAVHKHDLRVKIFDRNSTMYEQDCPHIRDLPAVPVLPGGFKIGDTSHDLSQCRCQTCENKEAPLDPQTDGDDDDEEQDELGTLLKEMFVKGGSKKKGKAGGGGADASNDGSSSPLLMHAENWICLFCGGIFCGRYENKHVFEHLVNTPGSHCLAISVNELAVWCHGCNKYIDTHMLELQPFVKLYEVLKFQQKAPSPAALLPDGGPCTHAEHVPADLPESLKQRTNLFNSHESQCCECARLTEPAQSKRARHALMQDPDDAGDNAKKTAGQHHEDYLCLTCFKVYCGRYEAGHMYKHVQTAAFQDHQLSLDLNSLNIWCYGCSAYINIREDFAQRHPNVNALLEVITNKKMLEHK